MRCPSCFDDVTREGGRSGLDHPLSGGRVLDHVVVCTGQFALLTSGVTVVQAEGDGPRVMFAGSSVEHYGLTIGP